MYKRQVLEDIQQGKTEVHEDSKFEVEVKDVKPNPYQPRKNFDDDKIQELADSIKLHGVFTPIPVSYTHFNPLNSFIRYEGRTSIEIITKDHIRSPPIPYKSAKCNGAHDFSDFVKPK